MDAVASGNGTASTGGTVSQQPHPQAGAVDTQPHPQAGAVVAQPHPQEGAVVAQPQAGVAVVQPHVLAAQAGAAIAGVGTASALGVPITSGGLQRRSKLGLNA